MPPPVEVTREGILRGDRAMRDAWWDALGLGSADFWRDWTARWRDPKDGNSLPGRRPVDAAYQLACTSGRSFSSYTALTAAIVAGASGGRSAAAALSRAC